MINETSASSTSSTARASMSRNIMFGVIGLVVLLSGFLIVAMLVNKNQDLRQQAATGLPDCAGGLECVGSPIAEAFQCVTPGGGNAYCCPAAMKLNATKTACVPIEVPPAVCKDVTVNGTIAYNSKVSLTCTPLAGAVRYEFRIKLPDGTIKSINPAAAGSANSAEFTLNQVGGFKAQCRGCTGAGAETCAPYQAI